MNTSDIHNLPNPEKLKLVVQLWDEIAASGESVSLPEDIIREAQRRSDELTADPSIAIDDQEMWRRIDG